MSDVTVVLPCLNEAASLPGVLAAIPEGYRPLVVDNNSTDDTGSWPATYRNVWIGNKPRPASLGSALRPR